MKIIGKIQSKLVDEDNNFILTLKIDDWNSKNKIENIDKTKDYQFEINEVKSKRSLGQNKLLWEIISDLSKEMQDDEMSIYALLLEACNAKYDYYKGLESQKENLLKAYRAVRIVRYDDDGLVVFKCYLGSSKFSVREMNQLIDKAIEWASEYNLRYDKEQYYE